MTSILKVNQIQNTAGGVPTAADLGLNVTGSVVQVQSNYGTGGQGTTSTSYVDLSVSVTITPKYSNSLLIVQFFGTAYVSGDAGKFSISRDGTLIGNGAGNTIAQMLPTGGTSYQPSSLTTYTTSGSTASTTFKVSVHNDGGSTYFPAGSADQWTAYAWEIAQ